MRKLSTPLQVVFNDIREVMESPVYRKIREIHIGVENATLVSLSDHDAVEGAREVTRTVLDIARRILSVLQERVSL